VVQLKLERMAISAVNDSESVLERCRPYIVTPMIVPADETF
jgi:hypothetical protein